MSKRIRRSLAALAVAAAWCAPAAGDEFECDDPSGCDALNTASGDVVRFRQGDIVSTERGFGGAGADGWVNVD